MALPPSFLSQLERHGCFSGCYGTELDAKICMDPAQPSEPAIFISCRDCLVFKAGVLRSLLPAGMTSDLLAEQVTQHLRAVRGFHDSFGGYHMKGGGFWLNAVYYDRCGIFLIDGARSRAVGSDLDLLLMAFRHGVATPNDARMLDPQHYQTMVVYVDFSAPLNPVLTKHNLLTAPQCRQQPTGGYHRVTLAEFMPVASAAPGVAAAAPLGATAGPLSILAPPATAVATSAQAAVAAPSTPPGPMLPGIAAAPRRRPRRGEICPVCHAEVRERALFTGVYVGCLC